MDSSSAIGQVCGVIIAIVIIGFLWRRQSSRKK